MSRNYKFHNPESLYFVSFAVVEWLDVFRNLTSFTKPDTDPIIMDLCYVYRYDDKRRMVEKRLPGKEWEYSVYDKMDRLILSQNEILRAKGDWHFIKYDVFGRVVYTGITPAGSRYSLQNAINGRANNSEQRSTSGFTLNELQIHYTNSNAYPTSIKELLTVNYYDTYPSVADQARPATIFNQTTLPSSTYRNRTLQGFPVASYVKNLENNKWTETWIWYDEKGRAIGSRTNNHLGGYTIAENNLDFDGSVLNSNTFHKRTSNDTEVAIQEAFTYDTKQRLLKHTHKINDNAAVTLTENSYDELGRVKSKEVGDNLQTVNYGYNIKSWLTNINNVSDLTNSGAPQDLFAFKINYEQISTSNPHVRPMYNGNISETSWRTSSDNIQRKYEYAYDGLDRILGAYFRIPGSTVQGSYDEYLTYDSNGNIQTLQRYGEEENTTYSMLIDDLLYEYDDGNKLLNVTDEEVHPSGFNDGNIHTQTQKDDFIYDLAGNLIEDRNKGITSISYNHLNQPMEIIVSKDTLSGSITYIYDADGNKLQKKVMEAQALTTTDYLSGFQYLDGKLDFIPHSEGYVKAVNTGGTTEYHYVYNFTDHLGNIRLSYGRDPETDEVAILKENHYYPFGLEHQGYVGNHRVFEPRPEGLVSLVPVRNYLDDSYRYSFGSKEEQPELGLNWMDFHARNYMPDIVRTMTMDPLAEKFVSLSPYSFLNNNPLSNIDPTGASTIELTGAAVQEFIEWLKNEINSKRDEENLGNGGDGPDNNDSMNRPIPIGDYSRGSSRRVSTDVSSQNNEYYSGLGAISWFSGTVAEGVYRNSTYYAENFISKYGTRLSSASEITAKTRASMANTARNAKGVGYGMTGVNILLASSKFADSNKNWGDYGELGLGLTSSTLGLFRVTAPIGIGVGIIDLSGGFDGFYNHLNQQEKLYQSTGGIMVPTTGIPTFIRLKKN